nr:uncharacterized protein LOC129438810 [Misgurnus anguillicaudatus]
MVLYTPGRRQRPATGFLEERMRNVRKRMRSTSTSRSMTQKTPPQMPDNGASARALLPECTIPDEHALQLKEWLRNNSQPLSQIETYMQNTAVNRAKWIRDNNWTIDQILEEFPCLMTKGMIAQDFLVLHGDAASKLFETWLPIYADKILYLARKEGRLTLPLDGLTPDGVGELALRQLPALLPPTTSDLQTCWFSATIAVFLVNWVIHVNRVEPESFFFEVVGGGSGGCPLSECHAG